MYTFVFFVGVSVQSLSMLFFSVILERQSGSLFVGGICAPITEKIIQMAISNA